MCQQLRKQLKLAVWLFSLHSQAEPHRSSLRLPTRCHLRQQYVKGRRGRQPETEGAGWPRQSDAGQRQPGSTPTWHGDSLCRSAPAVARTSRATCASVLPVQLCITPVPNAAQAGWPCCAHPPRLVQLLMPYHIMLASALWRMAALYLLAACCAASFLPHARQRLQVLGLGGIRWIENTFWRERYCWHHSDASDVVKCTSCGRLRMRGSDDVAPLGEGRHTCLRCLQLTTSSTEDAEPLFSQLLAWSVVLRYATRITACMCLSGVDACWLITRSTQLMLACAMKLVRSYTS